MVGWEVGWGEWWIWGGCLGMGGYALASVAEDYRLSLEARHGKVEEAAEDFGNWVGRRHLDMLGRQGAGDG